MPKSPTRREFLSATTLAACGFATATPAAAKPQAAKSCIFINLVGGPAHLDTFDPKPTAPSHVRGPFRPIATRVPGLHLSELFPKLASLTDKFSLIRSMHHTAPPVHECGFQLLNTGRLFRDGPEWPSIGAVLSLSLKQHDRSAAWWHLGPRDVATGIAVSHGQDAGFLSGLGVAPLRHELAHGSFDVLCRLAVMGVRSIARFVTINQFNTVFDSPSWDCHADGGSLRTDLGDIRNTVAPSFDTAFSALLIDLDERGLLDSTLVVATGEFGRTPKLNCNGGRDHWANAWTAIVAGGGVKGGRVVGKTDVHGTEPTDRPVTPQELVATIFHALGVSPDATIPGPDGTPVAVYPGVPVTELF